MAKVKKCRYFKKPCIEHDCVHYQKIIGTDPQTGQLYDQYMCSDLWNNILLIENTQRQNGTGAAIESFRNEMVTQNNQLLQLTQIGIENAQNKTPAYPLISNANSRTKS